VVSFGWLGDNWGKWCHDLSHTSLKLHCVQLVTEHASDTGLCYASTSRYKTKTKTVFGESAYHSLAPSPGMRFRIRNSWLWPKMAMWYLLLWLLSFLFTVFNFMLIKLVPWFGCLRFVAARRIRVCSWKFPISSVINLCDYCNFSTNRLVLPQSSFL